jgi:DNA-binding response OmpR family regulator
MQATATVLVYSDDSNTREQVRLATGRRPAPDAPVVEFVECATPAAAVKELDKGGIDVCVFDGEAVPMGGMGLCRQVKDEVFQCPPVLVLIGRPQDAWLATWSRADAAVTLPVEPVEFASALASLLRQKRLQQSA